MIRFTWFGKLIVVIMLLFGCTKRELPIGTEVFEDPRDGRIYPTVQIGEQLWMAKNLAFVSDSSWCYKDDSTDCDDNGRLYTWEDACEVCPEGWRLPTEKDWIQLEAFLGMAHEELQNEKFRGTDQGARLRVGGDTGFDAPISGYRRPNGSYDRRGQRSAYWLSTEIDSSAAWVHPKGKYTLYYGEKPAQITGEAIEVPSKLSVVIVRVEVKNKNDADDMAAATKLFNGITISGPTIMEFPELDLLSGFDQKVVDEANKRMDEAMVTTEFSKMIATPEDVPGKVSYLLLAAGSKGGWGVDR